MRSVGQAARHMEGVQQMEGGFLTSVLNLIKKRDKCLLCDAISLNVQDLPGDEIIFSFFTVHLSSNTRFYNMYHEQQHNHL